LTETDRRRIEAYKATKKHKKQLGSWKGRTS